MLDGDRVVVLSTDDGLRRLIVDSITQGPEIQRLVQRVMASVDAAHARMEEAVRLTNAGLASVEQAERARAEVADLERRIADGEPTAEQMEAREALYQEMLKHGPPPTEAEMEAARSSWL